MPWRQDPLLVWLWWSTPLVEVIWVQSVQWVCHHCGHYRDFFTVTLSFKTVTHRKIRSPLIHRIYDYIFNLVRLNINRYERARGYPRNSQQETQANQPRIHDEVIEWKHFPLHWPFVRGIHRSPVNSPHKGQWRVTLMFSLICAWTNGWAYTRDAGDLIRHRAHNDVTVRHHV